MKTHIGLLLSILSLSAGVIGAGATESVRVQSSRNLRVVVIDSSKPGAARSSVHETFAASLAASLKRQGGAPLPVKLSEETDANQAAEDLRAGIYDAALFFEGSLPSVMRTSEFAVSRGNSEAGVPVRIFHLALRNDDAAMVSIVTSAFNETVKAPRFQEALSRSAAIHVVASNSL
jgi:Mrp family chromosome partitioning ATPase